MRFFILFVAVLFAHTVHGGIITAHVEVVDSPLGEFVPLQLGDYELGYSTRYVWSEIPALLREQPLHVWRVIGSGSGPAVPYGIISFNVLTDGPVWMAVTTRFGGGGNASGDWIPELSTRADLEADGWVEIATGLKSWRIDQDVPGAEYIVFERQSVAGESFTYRTEKYLSPLPLTTQFNPVPEPPTVLIFLSGIVAVWLWRSRLAGKS